MEDPAERSFLEIPGVIVCASLPIDPIGHIYRRQCPLHIRLCHDDFAPVAGLIVPLGFSEGITHNP